MSKILRTWVTAPRRACVHWLALVAACTLLGGTISYAQELHSLRGRVVEADGEPVAAVTVFIPGTRLVVDTDEEGRFTLGGLDAGRYRVRFERLGYLPEEVPVTVQELETSLTVVLTLRPIEVEGLTAIGSPEELDELRQRLREVPGAVDLIESDEIQRTRQANLKDVLQFTPGVYVQPRFGAADESQLSIRGSGLRNNFHLRGVNILVNGMPYRSADGFTDFESLELLTTSNVQVYKGGNALRFGGSTLGGAINLETKTGYTADPFHAFAEGGSFGFLKAQVSSGDVLGPYDYYGSYAYTSLEGYRDFAEQRRDRVNAHLGAILSPWIDLRGFYLFAHVEEQLPGSLTREEFAADPRQANPINVEDRWGRDYVLHHVGLQLRTQPTTNQRVEIAPYFQYRDIIHPIFRVLDQVSRDVGAELRYENTALLAGRENRFTAGFQPAFGRVDNLQHDNVAGDKGELRKDQLEEATSLAIYLEDVFAITPRLSAVLGLRYDHSGRRLEDFFLGDGDQTDERDFEALMPKLGILYDLSPIEGQIFANVSRSFEPPLLLELNSFTAPGFIDLDAQDAWQLEIGSRGRAGGWSWQVAGYDIELRDEILNVNVQPFPDAPFTVPTYRNAAETRHYGLEAGLEYTLPFPLLTEINGGDDLGFRAAYTFARYEYVEDAAFAGNEIPGAPEHVLHGELTYRHPSGLMIQPNFEWVPGSTFVDSGNTFLNDGWAVLGLRSEWSLPGLGTVFFLEARNLTDKVYSPAVSVDDGSGRFFQPADARSFYGGFRWDH